MEIDFGAFDSLTDEGFRSGQSTDGALYWELTSPGPPTHIGFSISGDKDFDQIHKIIIVVPGDSMKTGSLQLSFETRFSGNEQEDGTSGFDNIRITAFFDCSGGSTPEDTPAPVSPAPVASVSTPAPITPAPVASVSTPAPITPAPVASVSTPVPTTPAPTPGPTLETAAPGTDECRASEVIFEDDFEDSTFEGWVNPLVSELPSFSSFLGRYYNETSGPDLDPWKVFTVPKDAVKVLVEFDFYEIDR